MSYPIEITWQQREEGKLPSWHCTRCAKLLDGESAWADYHDDLCTECESEKMLQEGHQAGQRQTSLVEVDSSKAQ